MNDLHARVAELERSVRRQRLGLLLLGVLACALVSIPSSQAQQGAETIRAKGLIIEDDSGRPRILLGAPLPSQGTGEPRAGMRINDTRGFERLGLSLYDSGRMVVGIDAPPGTGSDLNRERITLVADAKGGGYIRFLDRTTSVPAVIYLDAENQVWLEFSDYKQTPPIRRRIGLKGEETIR